MSTTAKIDGVRVVLVLGSWSSGSTAIAGYLSRAGAWSCPPHQMTNDPLTPDSHEPKAFRDALCTFFDELTLTPIRNIEDFREFFVSWLNHEISRAEVHGLEALVIKHPISAFVIPEILSVCDPEVVVVVRPLEHIERTRQRRGWHPIYGSLGAQKIYSSIFSSLLAAGKGFSAVSYPEFLKNLAVRRSLVKVAGLSPAAEMILSAENWLRQPAAVLRTDEAKG